MKRALIIVDVQPAFITPWNKNIVGKIKNLLETKKYDLHITSVFHAEKGSIWYKQQKWVCPKDKNTAILEEIKKELNGKNVIEVIKTTKSVFKGKPNIIPYLKKYNIKEIHIVGYDTNDCIVATAFESFDRGFLTYVLENYCQSSSSNKLHKDALSLLRYQNMTIK